MRRKTAVLITTLAILALGATAAYAAFNTYAGTNITYSSKGAGTQAKPVGISFKQTLQANNTNPSLAAAVLTHITVKQYGLVSNAGQFPTCSPKLRW